MGDALLKVEVQPESFVLGDLNLALKNKNNNA